MLINKNLLALKITPNKNVIKKVNQKNEQELKLKKEQELKLKKEQELKLKKEQELKLKKNQELKNKINKNLKKEVIKPENLFTPLNFKSKLILKNIKTNYLSLLGKIYYINMENRTDRKKIMEENLSKLWLPFERFNAFAPDLDNFELLKSTYHQINFDFFNRRLRKNAWTKGTIGCFMSHYLLMKKIYEEEKDNNFKYYLILEDDCLPTLEHIKASIEFAENYPDLDILRINSFLKLIENNSITGWKIRHNHFMLSTSNKEDNLIRFDGGTHFVMIKYSSILKILKFLESHELIFIDGMYNTKELNSYWYHYGSKIIYFSYSSIKNSHSNILKKNSKLLIK